MTLSFNTLDFERDAGEFIADTGGYFVLLGFDDMRKHAA